jgi:hypothetical protein
MKRRMDGSSSGLSSSLSQEVKIVLKRLGVLAAILALLGAGVSNARAQNKNRNPVVMTRNMDTGSDYKFVLNAKTPLEVIRSDGRPWFHNPLHGEDPFTPFSTPNQRIDVIFAKPGIDARQVFLIGNTMSRACVCVVRGRRTEIFILETTTSVILNETTRAVALPKVFPGAFVGERREWKDSTELQLTLRG